MAKLRLGVIGAGSWTVSSHLPFLAAHRDEVEFTIINRRNPELLKKLQGKFEFKEATTDWHEVIEAKPDIVVVGSPPGYHHDQAKAALEAGAHVMCEKPFTIAPADAWDLDETVKRTGKALILAYGWNYRPMVIQAHRMMHEDGGVGEIEHVALHMDSVTRELLSETGSYPAADPELIPQPDTWSRPETSGGGYGQAQLTHLLGVSLWITDLRGQDVFALMSAPLGAAVELHDAVAMRYTNGAIGTMSGASSHLGGADNRHAVEVRVVGSKGMFHLDLRENLLWRYRNPQDDVRVPLEADAGLYNCQGPIDALVEAGMGRPFANNSPAELGARTVEILDAAYRSAASGVLEHVKQG
ncbi:MAG TPA: Gfo/Idh/MocA family oxidoreductase [Candidatus Limnocylindrales bacterium]|nr:Gfo/Idh/MocA family oxidoreductase [Candidatus Limnocylindrales bacterium]